MKLGFWMLSSNLQFVMKTTSVGLSRPSVSGSGFPSRPRPRPLRKRAKGLGLKSNIVVNGKKRHEDSSKTRPLSFHKIHLRRGPHRLFMFLRWKKTRHEGLPQPGTHVLPQDAPPRRECSPGRDRIPQNSPRRGRSPKLRHDGLRVILTGLKPWI